MTKLTPPLEMLLDRLGIDPIIRSSEDLYKTQHAVYEESIIGIDLGYCFGDYPVGKFSPELRDDQINLSNLLV